MVQALLQLALVRVLAGRAEGAGGIPGADGDPCTAVDDALTAVHPGWSW
jgi:hypothetical protein